MADWKNPWDVDEIAQAFRRMGYTRPTPLPAAQIPRAASVDDEATRVAPSSPHGSPGYDDEESTHVVDSSRLRGQQRLPSFEGPAPASSPVREDDEVPTHVARTPGNRGSQRAPAAGRRSDRPLRQSTRPAAQNQGRAETARRREAGRTEASPTADRFARRAQAGSEEDEEARQRVAAAETQGLMDATDEGQRLTGARNETSVLFSLDSLIKQEQGQKQAARRLPPKADESLLVDTSPSLPAGAGGA
jgi:hypothetical protein